jgi:hypothetical protein
MNSELLKILGIIFGAGGLGGFLTYKLGNRKQDNSEFISVVTEYKQLVEGYKAEVGELRKEVLSLKTFLDKKHDEVVHLRNQLMIFESSHVDIPVPMWLKDTKGVMLFLNEEYERLILHPSGKTSKEYIGHTDFDVWPKEVARLFTSNDKEVMRKKKPVEFVETWAGQNDVVFEGRLLKFPRFLNRNTVIGIGGIIMEIKEVKKTKK